MKTENAETPPIPSDDNGNALFEILKNPNAHLTALHAASPPCVALFIFLGHSDLHSMSSLPAYRAEYQAGQNKWLENPCCSGAVMGTDCGTVHLSMANNRAREEVVVRRGWVLFSLGSGRR